MKVITVANEEFETKKALTDRVRCILYSYKDTQMLNASDFSFMIELLKRHPSAAKKIGCGVSGISVQAASVYNRKTLGFWLIRVDGTCTDFSFLECISPASQTKKVKKAFRLAIEKYTMHFKDEFFTGKDNYEDICEITGEVISFGNSHVDHKPPQTFDKLFNDFFSYHDLDINSIKICDTGEDGITQHHLIDTNLRDQWVRFHNQNAVLRVISRIANLSHVRHEAKALSEVAA